MTNLSAALVVATHPQQCRALVHLLEGLGLKPALAFTVEDARQVIGELQLALVCCVPELRDGTYRDVLAETKRRSLPMILVMRTDASQNLDVDKSVADCLTFPFSRPEAECVVCGALGGKPRRAWVASA